jgi:hypothetical protein
MLHSIEWDVITAFRDNLLVPSSRDRKSRRENKAWLKVTDNLFIGGGGDFAHPPIF